MIHTFSLILVIDLDTQNDWNDVYTRYIIAYIESRFSNPAGLKKISPIKLPALVFVFYGSWKTSERGRGHVGS